MTCPPGLALYPTAVEDEYECKCDDDNDQNIVRCLPHERRLILKVHSYSIWNNKHRSMPILTIIWAQLIKMEQELW